MNPGEPYSIVLMGAVLGLTAGISPGPLLALVVAQTVSHGKAEGIKVALAPLITDLPVIILVFFVLSRFSDLDLLTGIVSFLGGLFLVFLGYECFRSRIPDTGLQKPKARSLLKGVVANFLNPHPYIFWITVGTPLAVKAYRISPVTAALFFLSFYLMLVGSKIGIAMIVERSRNFLMNRVYLWTMRILGIVLLFFALIFFWEGLQKIVN